MVIIEGEFGVSLQVMLAQLPHRSQAETAALQSGPAGLVDKNDIKFYFYVDIFI